MPARPRLSASEPLERRLLLATMDVAVGGAAPPAARFTDADGSAVSVSVRGGAAAIRFAGDGLSHSTAGRQSAVSGTNVSLAAVTVTGASPKTSVAFKSAGGDGRFTLGGVTADGPLRRFHAPHGVLTGTLSTAGAVRQLRLLRAENAAITLGGAPDAPASGWSSVEITEEAVDTDLTSAAPIRRLLLKTWAGVDRGDVITAPSIAKAVVSRTFRGEMNLASAGALDVVHLEDAVITVSGDVASASIGWMDRASLYVGLRPLPPMVLDVQPSDFVTPSTIGRLRVGRAIHGVTSVVAARYIGRVQYSRISNHGYLGNRIYADRFDVLKVGVMNHWGRVGRHVTVKALDNDSSWFGSLYAFAL